MYVCQFDVNSAAKVRIGAELQHKGFIRIIGPIIFDRKNQAVALKANPYLLNSYGRYYPSYVEGTAETGI